MRIKQMLPMMILVLGLGATSWADSGFYGPDTSDPSKGWWNAPGSNPSVSVQDYNHDGYTGYKSTNSSTGEVHIYEYRQDPKTGDTIQVDITENNKKGTYNTEQTTTHKDGSSDTVDTHMKGGQVTQTETEHHNKDGGLTSSTYKNSDGTSGSTTYDGHGNITSITNTNNNGTTTTTKYDGKGNITSSTTTTTDPKTGTTTTTTRDRYGNLTGSTTKTKSGLIVQVCDGAGNCQHPALERAAIKKSGQQPFGQNFSGGSSNAKQFQTDALGKIKDKSRVQDLITGGNQQVDPKAVGKIKSEAGEKVGLNPQPLPPGPPDPDKLSGKLQFKKKLETGVQQQFKEKVNVQDWSSSAGSTGASQTQHQIQHKGRR